MSSVIEKPIIRYSQEAIMTTMKMNQARNIFQQRMFRVKDPISALTHLFGAGLHQFRNGKI